jgi:C-terminal processing protease CtpA/Prc
MVYSTKGMSVQRANELMFGRAGTLVKLSVIPAAKAKN